MMQQLEVDMLRRLSFLQYMTDAELDGLREIAQLYTFEPGEFLCYEGDAVEHCHLLIKGHLRVFSHSLSGRKVVLNFIYPGEFVGPLTALLDRPSTSTIQAICHSTTLGIQTEDLNRYMITHPNFAVQMNKVLASIVRQLYHRIVDLVGLNAVQRVAKTIYILSAKCGGNVPYTREDVASLAETSVETVIRVVRRLKEAGIVDCATRQIIVLSETRLKQVIEGNTRIEY